MTLAFSSLFSFSFFFQVHIHHGNRIMMNNERKKFLIFFLFFLNGILHKKSNLRFHDFDSFKKKAEKKKERLSVIQKYYSSLFIKKKGKSKTPKKKYFRSGIKPMNGFIHLLGIKKRETIHDRVKRDRYAARHP